MSENKPRIAAIPWWRRPIGIGLLGLALMVGGWKLSTWAPMSPHEQEQSEKLAELKGMQGDAEWKAKVEGYARSVQGQPRNEMAGRLVVFAGLVLFIGAGVRMYRTPVAKEDGEGVQARESDCEESVHGEGTSQS